MWSCSTDVVFILGMGYLYLGVLRLRMGEECCKRTRHQRRGRTDFHTMAMTVTCTSSFQMTPGWLTQAALLLAAQPKISKEPQNREICDVLPISDHVFVFFGSYFSFAHFCVDGSNGTWRLSCKRKQETNGVKIKEAQRTKRVWETMHIHEE